MKPSQRFPALISYCLMLTILFLVSCGKDNSPTGLDESNSPGTVKGRITYQGGTDFSGITVTLEKVSGGETGKIIAAKAAVAAGEAAGKIALTSSDAMTTVTVKDGSYQFTDVAPGEYSLTAQKTADHLAKVSNISVTAEGPTVVDVVLTATANIVGTVLLEGMDEYAGVLVYIAGTSYMAMTDSEGSFSISDVPIGDYDLVVNAHDYDVEKAAVTLDTAGDDVPVPVITLRKIGAIMGHVVDAVSGKPLANVIVKTMSAQVDTTDTYGIFAIDNVPAGSALLSLTLSGYDVRWVEVPEIKPGEAATVPYAIKLYTTGQTPPDVDPNLKGNRSITGTVDTGFMVKVSILKPDGTPTGISTTTDAGGNYNLPSIPYGTVKLKFDAGHQGEDWDTGQVAVFDVYLYEHYEENITFNVQSDHWGWVYYDRNIPPVADAGENQTSKTVPAPTITLDGTGSNDSDGSIGSYTWKQVSGPEVTLSSSSTSQPTFSPTEIGSYVFELVVTDDEGWESLPDQVIVSVINVSYEELGITLAAIPEGSFERGSYTISLSGFNMSTTEITQYQYESLTGNNPSNFSGSNDLPVETVTWYDVVKYCNLLSDAASLSRCYNEATWECNFNANGFRLPTEAEWEYACRAGTTTGYYSGDTEADLANVGWYKSNSGNTTHPVGEKTANSWGLYDMHGNASEWCNDWYGGYSSGDVNNPTGAQYGSYRVRRGGSWYGDAGLCRSALRNYIYPASRSDYIGFRVVSRGLPD